MTTEPGPITAYALSLIRTTGKYRQDADDWALRVEAAWRAMQQIQNSNVTRLPLQSRKP